MANLGSRRWLPAVYRSLSTQTSSVSTVTPSLRDKDVWHSDQPTAAIKKTDSKIKTVFPLSALPTDALLRSVFINTVSSKPWLLTPAISFLMFLCQPKKSSLFDVNRNKLLAWVMKQTVYKQFCGGETPVETKATMERMRAMGFRGTIITLATEIVFDNVKNEAHGLGVGTSTDSRSDVCLEIETWRQRTLGAVGLLDEGDQLAIKITGAGPRITDALSLGKPLPQQMLDALHEITILCKQRQARVLVDAESQLYQFGIFDVGIELMKKYNRDGQAVVFNTYQAYLKSTISTIANHLHTANVHGFTLGLKLVRGAYLSTEKRSLIHDTKQDTDNAYNTVALGALRQELAGFGGSNTRPFPSLNLILASHNKRSIFSAHDLHQSRLREGLPTVPVGFAQLQGMSDELSFGLLQYTHDEQSTRPEVYKCTTWGRMDECLGYLARRASENRDAAGRTQDEFEALKTESWRRLRSLFQRGKAQ